MAKANKIKTEAQSAVPQTQDDTAADIKKIGDLMREKVRKEADMNDEIAGITGQYQPELDVLSEQIKTLQSGVQSYCEAHREELTNGGKTKTGKFITGEVVWRQKPPSVRVSKSDQVIDTLKRMGLSLFVRTKEEVNKDAILEQPDQVRGIAGITVMSGVEQFEIAPFEAEV